MYECIYNIVQISLLITFSVQIWIMPRSVRCFRSYKIFNLWRKTQSPFVLRLTGLRIMWNFNNRYTTYRVTYNYLADYLFMDIKINIKQSYNNLCLRLYQHEVCKMQLNFKDLPFSHYICVALIYKILVKRLSSKVQLTSRTKLSFLTEKWTIIWSWALFFIS